MSLERKRRWEIVTVGFDEYLSLVGGDPDGQATSVGLRVPTMPTPAAGIETPPGTYRYLMNLASFSVGEGECVTIVGYRQLVTIGYAQPIRSGVDAFRVVEQEVETPFWRFPDGNIAWGLRTIGAPNAQGVPQPGPADVGGNAYAQSFALNWSDAPAVLFGPGTPPPPGRIYQNLAAYVPPNGGKFWGTGINSKQGVFYDLRTPWRTHGAWTSLNIPVRGPDTVAMMASVRQTDPSTRPVLATPDVGTGFYSSGLSSEEQFLQNFPNAIYWRVGAALIVEEA